MKKSQIKYWICEFLKFAVKIILYLQISVKYSKNPLIQLYRENSEKSDAHEKILKSLILKKKDCRGMKSELRKNYQNKFQKSLNPMKRNTILKIIFKIIT